jgi:hypothetical protein
MSHTFCIAHAVPPSEAVQLVAGSRLPVQPCSKDWVSLPVMNE